jgi:hypothetical protein
MAETDTDRVLLDCVKVSCPYCGADLLPLTVWDGCRPDGLKVVECGSCRNQYGLRQPSRPLVYPVEFLQAQDGGVKIMAGDKERETAFLKKREGLRNEKDRKSKDS